MMISTFVRLILSVRYVAFEGVASSTLAFLYFPEPSFYAALTLRGDFLATAHRPPRSPNVAHRLNLLVQSQGTPPQMWPTRMITLAAECANPACFPLSFHPGHKS